MEKKKIPFVQIILFGVTFAIAFFVTQYFLSNDGESTNAMLVKTAVELNKNMPKMIDAETRLDSTSVEKETLVYHYTLINIDKESAFFNFDEVKSQMMQKAQTNLNSNPVMKDYRENNISLHYIFKDKNKSDVFDFTVKPKTKN